MLVGGGIVAAIDVGLTFAGRDLHLPLIVVGLPLLLGGIEIRRRYD